MKKQLLTLCLLFLALFSFSQNLRDSRRSSYYTQIYKISNEEAKTLYKSLYKFSEDHLHTLYDYFPTDSLYKKTLPTGHYLFISTDENNLNFRIHSENNINLHLLNNHKDLIFTLSDNNGKEVTEASIYVKKSKVKYDPSLKAFVKVKTSKKGLVFAEYQGHTSIFEIDRQYNNHFYARAYRGIKGWYPIRLLTSPIRYIVSNTTNLIRWGSPPNPPGIYYRIKNVVTPNPTK
ncbi:MAG: hypothetical protein OEY34_07160, partial [Cyclobacteriaceae bacterium]|nr:hypothetical protein [Cyclobacteriaceae bacterium]